MFKFLNQGHKLMRIQSGIIAIATLAVLAAVITALALSSFTAEAQGTRGAIANLQLTSTTAGELTVSWDAASPVPTDYRIDWAKSGEDYKSWTVDEGHKYPDPSATTATIADLDHDTEYQIRMRARYYKGEHLGNSWGGPWAEATITVTGEPAETPTPEPSPEPTPEAGTIETLTATDDAAGQLVLTWSAPAAPNATPTDYHVSWAKSTEDYPADTTTDGNAHSTTATYTLAGLDYDTDYNVRVRARYTDGENTDSPWNGPWTETTAQVKLPLPMTPNMTGAAVSPASQVYLFWSEPSNDSITGYQILRGPDADNLAIIEDDTGSSSTSYTDTAPPAGQTHTYAVKARNASGLSPLSNTLTATVPAAEEEEVLITARHGSTGNTLVSNTGQTTISIRAVVGTHVNFVHERAMSFTTGNNPYGYHLTNSQLYLRISAPSSDPIPGVSIRNDNEGVPGQTVLYTMTTTSAIAGQFRLITFTTTDDFTLQPNTKYWLYVTINDGEAIGIQQTQSDDENVESNTDWEIGDSSYRAIDGAAWTEEHGENIRMNISGHAAPAFLVSNLDSPSTRIFFSRDTDTDSAKIAQAFSTANNENGTPTEFDFHGVIVQLGSAFSTASQLAARDILATVHKDSGGQPSDLVYTLTSPETYTVPVHSAPVTFSAPPGSILSSGITYWVKFEIAADSTFFTGGTSIVFEFATDNNEVQGPTTNNRWSIDNNSLWSPETLSWTLEVKSIKMSVLGSQRYGTLVSNIDQTYWAPDPTGPNVKLAQSFLTPPGPLGQQYRLHRVHINTTSQYPTQATVDLHADDDGAPGDHLASMIMPGDFAPGERTPADLITVAPGHTNLNPGTRYWIVITNEQDDNLLYISVTESNAQDSTSLDGWQIDNQRARSRPDKSWAILRGPLQMEVLGSAPFIRTNEADGPDLPGAGHNAHKTGAVVIPGIVSTGHLTAGLDRDHGQTGDIWWLDTERNHSYRIEVEFGDSQNNDTGGSAWTYFIEGDRRGTCCESDHNRDDGFTFVHLKHGEDERDRRYLIDVAAFDKLNHNSRIYNGPYTITMTDITGTDKVATNLYLGTRTASHLPAFPGDVEYAVPFTTGNHSAGYKLDRVRMHVPYHEALPELGLHANTSGEPGDAICDFLDPIEVQHHRPYAVKPLPIPFLDIDCSGEVLAANTTYWLALAGSGYFPALTDSDDQQTNRSGWSIGNVAAISTAGSWSNLSNGGTIPVEIWASKR